MVDVEIGEMKYDLGSIDLAVCKILQLASYEPIDVYVEEYDENKYCILLKGINSETEYEIKFNHDNVGSDFTLLIENLIKNKSLAQVERLGCDIRISNVTYAGYEYVHYNK